MKKSLKHIITVLLAACIMAAGTGPGGIIAAKAAARPVIRTVQLSVMNNYCMLGKGDKEKLSAWSGGKNITKKCTWKSSKKGVLAVSRNGVITGKKAGTAFITAKYKGKTSKKLRVQVIDMGSMEPGSQTGNGALKITYNANEADATLDGPKTQAVGGASGEILKFSTTVTPASGKKFLGWYDAPEGGNRIYETYKPSGDMTLYAHYTDENVQQVTFSLGCTYGTTYELMSKHASANDYNYFDYNWNDRSYGGPFGIDDDGNVTWKHTYTVSSDKKHFTVDDLPVPEIPGFTFIGWYTTNQGKLKDTSNIPGMSGAPIAFAGKKVDGNTEVDTSVTRLYARFSRKLTISFDDMRGGKYDDIVVDTYKSIEECGQKLPTVNLPGATFLGWTLDTDNHAPNWGAALPMITRDSKFLNCIEWHGYACPCGYVYRDHSTAEHTCSLTGSSSVNDDRHVFEDTDHITLYPAYKFQNVILSFDPNGGIFPVGTYENNANLKFDDVWYDPNHSYKFVGKMTQKHGGHPYGSFPIPGHLGEDCGMTYGNGDMSFPLVRRQNYVFDKWVYLDKDGNEQEIKLDTMITGNMDFYAKWKSGVCSVLFDPTDGTISKEEQERCGLTAWNGYYVTTESTFSGDGKQLPVPVSKEGREFSGWYTSDGARVDKDTQILSDMTLYAHWGTKTDNKPETQKPSTDNDNSSNKDTDSNNKNETVHAADMAMTDMEWKPVDKNSNHYTVEYGGKGNPTGLGFTANVLPAALKDSARNIIWTSSNPDIISVTAGKEVIYSPNWFDYFEFGSDTGDVVLTATSEDNPDVKFDIHVTVAKK